MGKIETKKMNWFSISDLKWALFGNDDDGVCGDTWFMRERECDWWKKFRWWVRNPLHNLFFYVPPFGYADGTWTFVDRKTIKTWYGQKLIRTFRKDDKTVTLNFREGDINSINREWYVGHRERGNLGFAFRKQH